MIRVVVPSDAIQKADLLYELVALTMVNAATSYA